MTILTVAKILSPVGNDWRSVQTENLVGMVTGEPYRSPWGDHFVGISSSDSCSAVDELMRRGQGVSYMNEILALGARTPSLGHFTAEAFARHYQGSDPEICEILLSYLQMVDDGMMQLVCRVICKIPVPSDMHQRFIDSLMSIASRCPAFDTGRYAVTALVYLGAPEDSLQNLTMEPVPFGTRVTACRHLGLPEPKASHSMN